MGVAPGMEDLTAITERTEYYDVAVESEDLFAFGLEGMPQGRIGVTMALRGAAGLPLGTQFLQGEPVQLWAETGSDGADIYLYRKDGSRELLLEGISDEYISTKSRPFCRWYVDQEGDYYCYGEIWRESEGMYSECESFLAKVLASGEILYEVYTEQSIHIRGFCQTGDGRIYLLLVDPTGNAANGSWSLAEADPATGELLRDSVWELSWNYEIYLGSAGSFPAVMGYGDGNNRQLVRMDMEDRSLSPILYFTGISYGWHEDLILQDYQVREDGVIELLWTEANRAGGLLERLKMEKVERIPVVVRGNFAYDRWMENRVMQFNRENDTYHVVLEDCGVENDEEEFARLTSIQIGAGKGPDIIKSGLMKDYMEGLLDKGALEDLAPYMEASDIREEEYFPLTFASLRQGEQIYGVQPRMWVRDFKMEEELLEDRGVTDIEMLADALLAREEKGRYCDGYDAAEVLRVFLQGTEDLWGMVDWESGSCEFHTPLFGKLLEAASRYGDDGRKSMESITVKRNLFSVLDLEGLAGSHAAEFEGKRTFGVLFDDGCHAVSDQGYALSINANSRNREGAWEFIRFLISEEAQSADFSSIFPPVYREAFDAWNQWILDKYTYINPKSRVGERMYNRSPVTGKMQAEFKERIEDARPLPIRTVPIVDIILEEAEDYFTGSKNAEEVSEVINKRVQMYLNERK